MIIHERSGGGNADVIRLAVMTGWTCSRFKPELTLFSRKKIKMSPLFFPVLKFCLYCPRITRTMKKSKYNDPVVVYCKIYSIRESSD